MSAVADSVRRWFDNQAGSRNSAGNIASEPIDWLRCMPFVALHLACLSVLWVGWSAAAIATAAALYVGRMFVITGFYHRYFAHRTFKTSRWLQGLMAFAGCCSVQRDPIWWAGHHAHHHAHADEPEDPHSPRLLGFLRSHVGWFMTPSGFLTRDQYVRDWQQFPELRFFNRFDWVPAVCLAFGLYGLGALLERSAPGLGTNGPQILVWGFFVSTVVLYHLTFTVNSLAHGWGRRRYATSDDSRNNWVLALLTLGEGWHNNHHHYPGSTRQGFYWWEIDITYYGLLVLSWLGLIWDLRPVPESVLTRNRLDAAPVVTR